jgi:hypothetical protein
MNKMAASISNGELRNLDEFLDQHPQIAQDLRKNPSLVNDANYLNSRQELKGFLESHNAIREDLRMHPELLMHRQGQYEKNEGPGR